jgi:hypothetical protein
MTGGLMASNPEKPQPLTDAEFVEYSIWASGVEGWPQRLIATIDDKRQRIAALESRIAAVENLRRNPEWVVVDQRQYAMVLVTDLIRALREGEAKGGTQ